MSGLEQTADVLLQHRAVQSINYEHAKSAMNQSIRNLRTSIMAGRVHCGDICRLSEEFNSVKDEEKRACEALNRSRETFKLQTHITNEMTEGALAFIKRVESGKEEWCGFIDRLCYGIDSLDGYIEARNSYKEYVSKLQWMDEFVRCLWLSRMFFLISHPTSGNTFKTYEDVLKVCQPILKTPEEGEENEVEGNFTEDFDKARISDKNELSIISELRDIPELTDCLKNIIQPFSRQDSCSQSQCMADVCPLFALINDVNNICENNNSKEDVMVKKENNSEEMMMSNNNTNVLSINDQTKCLFLSSSTVSWLSQLHKVKKKKNESIKRLDSLTNDIHETKSLLEAKGALFQQLTEKQAEIALNIELKSINLIESANQLLSCEEELNRRKLRLNELDSLIAEVNQEIGSKREAYLRLKAMKDEELSAVTKAFNDANDNLVKAESEEQELLSKIVKVKDEISLFKKSFSERYREMIQNEQLAKCLISEENKVTDGLSTLTGRFHSIKQQAREKELEIERCFEKLEFYKQIDEREQKEIEFLINSEHAQRAGILSTEKEMFAFLLQIERQEQMLTIAELRGRQEVFRTESTGWTNMQSDCLTSLQYAMRAENMRRMSEMVKNDTRSPKVISISKNEVEKTKKNDNIQDNRFLEIQTKEKIFENEKSDERNKVIEKKITEDLDISSDPNDNNEMPTMINQISSLESAKRPINQHESIRKGKKDGDNNNTNKNNANSINNNITYDTYNDNIVKNKDSIKKENKPLEFLRGRINQISTPSEHDGSEGSIISLFRDDSRSLAQSDTAFNNPANLPGKMLNFSGKAQNFNNSNNNVKNLIFSSLDKRPIVTIKKHNLKRLSRENEEEQSILTDNIPTKKHWGDKLNSFTNQLLTPIRYLDKDNFYDNNNKRKTCPNFGASDMIDPSPSPRPPRGFAKKTMTEMTGRMTCKPTMANTRVEDIRKPLGDLKDYETNKLKNNYNSYNAVGAKEIFNFKNATMTTTAQQHQKNKSPLRNMPIKRLSDVTNINRPRDQIKEGKKNNNKTAKGTGKSSGRMSDKIPSNEDDLYDLFAPF